MTVQCSALETRDLTSAISDAPALRPNPAPPGPLPGSIPIGRVLEEEELEEKPKEFQEKAKGFQRLLKGFGEIAGHITPTRGGQCTSESGRVNSPSMQASGVFALHNAPGVTPQQAARTHPLSYELPGQKSTSSSVATGDPARDWTHPEPTGDQGMFDSYPSRMAARTQGLPTKAPPTHPVTGVQVSLREGMSVQAGTPSPFLDKRRVQETSFFSASQNKENYRDLDFPGDVGRTGSTLPHLLDLGVFFGLRKCRKYNGYGLSRAKGRGPPDPSPRVKGTFSDNDKSDNYNRSGFSGSRVGARTPSPPKKNPGLFPLWETLGKAFGNKVWESRC